MDVAGRRTGPPRLRVRRRGVPRARSHGNRRRSRLGHSRTRPGRGTSVLRGLAARPRPHGDDQDAGWIRRHAPPSRDDRGCRRRRRRRGRGGRNDRTVGRSRGRRPVRPSRDQASRRSQGLCRSVDVAARAGRTYACGRCAGPAAAGAFVACSRSGKPFRAGIRSRRRGTEAFVAAAGRRGGWSGQAPCRAGRRCLNANGITACCRFAPPPSGAADGAHRQDGAGSVAATGASARVSTREADVSPRRRRALAGSRQDSARAHAACGGQGSRGSACSGTCRGSALGARRRRAARPCRCLPARGANGEQKGRTYH